jgi:sugar phosphate permease
MPEIREKLTAGKPWPAHYTFAPAMRVGNTIWHPTAIPTLANRFPDRKGLVVSIHGMGGNIGDAVAPFLAGLLLSGFVVGGIAFNFNFTWRQVMIFNVVPGIVMSVAIFWMLGKLQMDGKAKGPDKGIGFKGVLKGFGGLLKNRTMMLLAISSSFRSMTQGSLMVFVPLYLANTMGYSPWAIGAAMMGLQLAGFIASPIAGAMSDKVGPRSIMMSSMAMTAVVIAMMIFTGGTPLFVFFVAVLGFFLFAIRAVLQAWTLDATPKGMGGSAIGLLFGFQAVGSSIGLMICGKLADSFGLLSTFYFMAVTIVIASLSYYVFERPINRLKRRFPISDQTA